MRVKEDHTEDSVVFRGKQHQFSRLSFGCIPAHAHIRQAALAICLHPYFDSVILFLIVTNSIFIGMQDYATIDTDPESDEYAMPVSKGSWRNTTIEYVEPFYVYCFLAEMLIKVTAMGLWSGKESYLRDNWNILDGTIVLSTMLQQIPNMPNVSMFRSFRILRPLRSLSSIPELRNIIGIMFKSLPELGNVITVLCFIFALFGILGMQLYSGRQHFRCRVTPFPVTFDWITASDQWNFARYQCLDAPNFNLLDDGPRPYAKDKSPWATPQRCFWPVDDGDLRICDPTDSGYPQHVCIHDHSAINASDWRWCGSNYDARGNARFKGPVVIGSKEYNTDELMAAPTYTEDLTYGFMNFDNFATGFLTILQCITMEGWVYIMYQLMDGWSAVAAALFFSVLIIFGSFFILNLLLAVIESNYHSKDDEDDDEAGRKTTPEAKDGAPNEKRPCDDLAIAMDIEPESATLAHAPAPAATPDEDARTQKMAWHLEIDPVGSDQARPPELALSTDLSRTRGIPKFQWSTVYENWERSDARRRLSAIVSHGYFSAFVTTLIVMNTITLSLDHHPMDPTFGERLEMINFALTVAFAVEMVLKLVAWGVKEYSKDLFNRFDAAIVVVSLIELAAFPPPFLRGEPPDDGEDSGGIGGAILALRSFRLFRVFKLARKWVKMRILLAKIARTCVDIGYFGLLLCLFMFIFALIGCQFFANRLHFDENNYPVKIADTPEYKQAYVPRSNFDSLLLGFTTLFQVLSGENWNGIMYDCWRATNWVSTLYFVALVFTGIFIMINLFIAILLGNFCADDGDTEAATTESKQQSEAPEKNADHEAPPAAAMTEGVASPGLGGQGRSGKSSTVKITPILEDVHKEGAAAAQERANAPDGSAKATMEVDSDCSSGAEDDDMEPQLYLNIRSEVLNAEQAPRTPTFKGDGSSGPTDVGDSPAPDVSDTETTVSNTTDVQIYNEEVFPLAPGRILGCMDEYHPLRVTCAKIIAHPRFDNAILFLIILSSIFLALDDPLMNPNSALKMFLTAADYVMIVLFTIEMTLKILATGFLFHDKAYLTNNWNVLDFIVVIISYITTFGSSNSSFKSLRTLRALRALRPLRVVKRAPGLRIVVNAMFAAIPDVLNVVAVCLLFYLIFSILGVTFFKGQLRSCSGSKFDAMFTGNDADATELREFLTDPKPWRRMNTVERSWFVPNSRVQAYEEGACDATRSQFPDQVQADWASLPCCKQWPDSVKEAPSSEEVCLCWGMKWERQAPQHFDNVINALLTFFELSTTEGWVDVMYLAVDSRGIGMQPVRDANLYWVWFFMLFLMIGGYLVLNLFVGVVVDNFNSVRKKAEGDVSLLTEAQQAWVKTQQTAARIKPKKKLFPPNNVFGQFCFDVVQAKWFEVAIMSCICLNTVVMAMTYFGMEPEYESALEAINFGFAAIFTLEAAMKITGLQLEYFNDSWNRFDFSIVLGTNIGLLLMWTTGAGIGSVTTIVRTFRVGRILRLIQGGKGLKRLFNTLLLTLPGLSNISALLFLLLFIFTVMGTQLFAKVEFHGDHDERANFRTFWHSVLTLIRFATGENWNGLMHDLARMSPGCDEDPEYDPQVCGFKNNVGCKPMNGCGTVLVYPYMIIFNLVVAFVFINLFIGVILEGFDLANESFGVSEEDFERFSAHWSEFDPQATCYMDMESLKGFVATLHKPLGFANDCTDSQVLMKIARMDLETFKDKVHFKDVLIGLANQVVAEDLEKKGERVEDVAKVADEKLNKKLTQRKRRNAIERQQTKRTERRLREHFSGQIILRYMRIRVILPKRLKEISARRKAERVRESRPSDVPPAGPSAKHDGASQQGGGSETKELLFEGNV